MSWANSRGIRNRTAGWTEWRPPQAADGGNQPDEHRRGRRRPPWFAGQTREMRRQSVVSWDASALQL